MLTILLLLSRSTLCVTFFFHVVLCRSDSNSRVTLCYTGYMENDFYSKSTALEQATERGGADLFPGDIQGQAGQRSEQLDLAIGPLFTEELD